MTDPWNAPEPGQQPVAPPSPEYGPEYTWAPLGNGQYGWVPFTDGPPGKVRSTAVVLLLAIVTFGIYTYVYNYKVHDEMKRHSGRGLGGGIALLLTFLAGVAMPFLTPNEVGNLYARKGRPKPVSALTGLWLMVPAIVGYAVMFAIVLSGSVETNPDATVEDFPVGAFLAGFAAVGLTVVAGGIVWLVKTNGALNRYWLDRSIHQA